MSLESIKFSNGTVINFTQNLKTLLWDITITLPTQGDIQQTAQVTINDFTLVDLMKLCTGIGSRVLGIMGHPSTYLHPSTGVMIFPDTPIAVNKPLDHMLIGIDPAGPADSYTVVQVTEPDGTVHITQSQGATHVPDPQPPRECVRATEEGSNLDVRVQRGDD